MLINRLSGAARVVSLTLSVASLVGSREADLKGAGSNSDSVPFQLDESGVILVPAGLGALAAEMCILDTGSSRSLISDQLQSRLGLAPVARAEVLSVAGATTHEVVRLPAVSVGEATREGLLATVIPETRMKALADRAACVLGHDFLAARNFTIDYEHQTLRWRSRLEEASSRCTRIPLLSIQGRYVIDLQQSSGPGQAVRLVPDSGASEIVLFRQPLPPALPLTPLFAPTSARLTGATGARKVSAVRLERLRVGTLELSNRRAYLVDRTQDEQTGAQGLLPLHLFARVSFSATEQMMVLTAR